MLSDSKRSPNIDEHLVTCHNPCSQPVDWYCAQQRPLQALQTVLHLNLASLPKWLFIIDDDTLVHPWNLLRMLTDPPANHEALQLYGSERRGGAGFILSQGALKNLTSHIQISDMSWDQGALTWRQEPGQTTLLDACLSRLLGGNWCYMHSDHVMGLCARSAGIHIVDRNTTMAQWCPVSEGRGALQSPHTYPPHPSVHPSPCCHWSTLYCFLCLPLFSLSSPPTGGHHPDEP